MVLRIAYLYRLAMLALMTCFCSPANAEILVIEDGLVFLGSTDVVDHIIIRDRGVLLTDGTLVTGNIRVEQGGALAATRTTIEGNVKADRGLLVDLGSCSVHGNVDLKRTGGPGTVFGLLPSVSVIACDVLGNLRISRSDVNSLVVVNNQIEGGFELTRNRSFLPANIEGNVVQNDLDCD